ncbi:hypothetical protein KSS87_000235 [Heliosperma pusillum]|nr:hypothetical protein KSS87_000235 [Heliosperma pusillum]
MEVDLEVVGRHAMLFDDDATLEFVNSKEALIEWNSLFIDRFDVRNLIDVAPPSFRHLPASYYGAVPDDDSHLFADLDSERFADLFAVNDDDNGDNIQLADEKRSMYAGGYNYVPFSYGNSADSTAQKNSEMDMNASSFHPSFPVPENLLQNLPPSEKVHQIIARTAMFVGQHGGQSEIVLRVKQGDNPTFGFLMPHHHLHPYFRYLVDHLEVLKTDNDSKSQADKSNGVQASGALSLLGTIYGTGEDEDVEDKVEIKSEQTVSGGTASASDLPKSDQSDQTLSAADGVQKDETVSVHPRLSKVKLSAPSSKNITSIKPGRASSIKCYGTSISSSVEKPKPSSLFPLAHAEKSFVDPPSEVKKLVDRIVEIILKNGKDFETVLIEQDKKHDKFPFLLPSNQYHQYYLRVLKKVQESRISGKTFGSGKDGSSWQEIEKDADHQMKESEGASLDGSDDLDLNYDKKDKFKMVIPKTKKDSQEQPPKESQQQSRVTVDATAAAAILQAAARGIRNPNFKIFSNKTSHDSSIEGGPSSNSALKENGESSRAARGDKDISKIVASEADTSDSALMRQQKLKAERLRRAKMFAAMIKSGAAPLGTEPPRSSSLEPAGSGPGNSGLADKIVVEEVKGREGSHPLMEFNDENEQKLNKRRHYRSRKHDDGQGEEESKENEEDTGEDDDEKTRSTKRHKSRHSSRRHRDRSKDRHKHRRRHSSSKSKESRHRRKRDSSSSQEDDDDSHHRHNSDSSLEEERKHYKRRHKHESSSEEESKHVNRRHKESSRKHRHRERSGKNDRSRAEEGELEEGEIRTRSSDQSLSAIGEDASREASVDASKSPLREKRSSVPPSEPTEVPDELRAKIRAMLLATM